MRRQNLVRRGAACAVAAGLALSLISAPAVNAAEHVLVAATSGTILAPDLPSAASAERNDVPALTKANFASPPVDARPIYRWWMPAANTTDAELRAEVKAMADAGAGGFEIAGFGVTGGAAFATPAILQQVGWGTPAWKHKMEVVYTEAAKYDLRVDQNFGAYYPPAVPTLTLQSPEVQQKLIYNKAFVASNTSYNAAPPAPATTPAANASPAGAATPVLISVVAARCAVVTCNTDTAAGKLLEPATVVELPVTAGLVNWTAPNDGGMWVVLSFYQSADGQSLPGLAADAAGTGTTIYSIDHLSVGGAKAMTDYFDQSILSPAVRDAIDSSGKGAVFEDSLELSANAKWTGDFASEFQDRRGYPVSKILPVIAGSGGQGVNTGEFAFTGDATVRAQADYRNTVSDLYISQYAQHIQDWADDHGLDYRAQQYGLPIDIGTASASVGLPEGEVRNFSGAYNGVSIGAEQGFKVVAGGAHFADNTRVNFEGPAVNAVAYRTTMAGVDNSGVPGFAGAAALGSGNLDGFYHAYAGGATAGLWHGFDYAGDAPIGAAVAKEGDVSWPGYHAWFIFSALDIAEAWGPRMPQWDDVSKINDSLARQQFVLRQGRPSVDVALYYQDYGMFSESSGATTYPTPQQLPTNSALTTAGYTSEYVSPSFLLDDSAVFENGALFPTKAAYKALVLNQQKTMPVAVAKKLLILAQQGLPIVIVGDAPNKVPSGLNPAAGDAALQSVVTQLLDQPSVSSVSSIDALPVRLRARNVSAATPFAEPSVLQTVRRVTADTVYYWVYNQSDTSVSQNLTVAGTGAPYVLNSWTGKINRVAEYTATTSSVTIPVVIAAHDTAVFAVSTKDLLQEPAARYAPTATSSDAEISYNASGDLVARATTTGAVSTTLTTGATVTSQIDTVPDATTLSSWNLDVVSYEKPASFPSNAVADQIVKVAYNDIPVTANPDGTLPSWLAITTPVNLSTKSGVGTYTTTVDLPTSWTGGRGGYLDLGSAVDTVTVTVNGSAVPVNQSDIRKIDVGPYLQAGSNTITVRVATTMLNAVKANNTRYFPGKTSQKTGLLGPVVLTPYGQVIVAPAPAVQTFVDVPQTHPFFADIEWMHDNGLANGTVTAAGLKYVPADDVSRQAMAAFLYRLAGNGWTPAPGTRSFADVMPSSVFYIEIEWMHAQGLANGTARPTGKPLFKPGAPVERQASAAFLWRLAGSPTPTSAGSFKDVKPNSIFGPAIAWNAEHGIAKGYKDGTYRPAVSVDRQAMAAFLHRFADDQG